MANFSEFYAVSSDFYPTKSLISCSALPSTHREMTYEGLAEMLAFWLSLIGLLRCGKSCRLRWINYLRPDLKRGSFTEMEENQIIQLHSRLGNR